MNCSIASQQRLREPNELVLLLPAASSLLRVHKTDLGGAIRALRRARRLTIEHLAWHARMHPTYLSGIERGLRNPSWVKLANVAEALEIPVSLIVLDAEERCLQEAIRLARPHSDPGPPR